MEELTKMLSELDALMFSEGLSKDALYEFEWNYYAFPGEHLLHETIPVIYEHLSDLGKKLDEQRQGLFKELFAEFLNRFLDVNPWKCPHYIQRKEKRCITLPFVDWEDEVNTIAALYNSFSPKDIEERYYNRCFQCRDTTCPYRIIRPIENGPYWRQSEYELRDEPVAPADEPPQKETRQQKAAKTREEDASGDSESILRPLCKKLEKERMAKKADDGINFIFLGDSALYAYLARQVTQKTNLDRIPWTAIGQILATDFSPNVLKKSASIIGKKGKLPKGSSKIDSLINETISEVEAEKR